MIDGRPKMVAFGELMMRLNPPGNERFVQAGTFEVRFTGGEANAAVLLSGFGFRTYAVARVPGHELGQACINYVRRFGVNTDFVARGGDHLGIMYLEAGASQRASKVIYDRDHTSMQGMQPDEFDWPAILEGADWLHFSGTAPALGENVRRVLREGLETAGRMGVTVSCDLNYRAKLWGTTDAGAVMKDLMPHVDVLIGNEEDVAKVFGIKAEGSDVVRGDLQVESYQRVAEQMAKTFGFRHVATTLRTSISASVNRWSGMLYDGTNHYLSRTYEINPIVDRVGGGDSFTAGLIYGLVNRMDGQACVEFATAASCLKHSIPGDFNLVSLDEVKALLSGDASGRVQR
jgi:2-dehydro-3-deoxygluconokinase